MTKVGAMRDCLEGSQRGRKPRTEAAFCVAANEGHFPTNTGGLIASLDLLIWPLFAPAHYLASAVQISQAHLMRGEDFAASQSGKSAHLHQKH